MWYWWAKDAWILSSFWGTTPLIPVTPYMSQMVEDVYWEEERYDNVPILDPIEGENAPLFCIDPPSADHVMRTLPDNVSGGFTFAAEYNDADYGDDGDGSGYLLMANYASGPWGITLRYHDFEIEDDLGVTFDEGKGFTISPSYTVSDNLLLVAEYRRDKAFGVKANSYALEALFTF